MVPKPWAVTGCRGWLDNDQVESERESGQDAATRELTGIEESHRRRPYVGTLVAVECLLGQPEVSGAPPANLDDDE